MGHGSRLGDNRPGTAAVRRRAAAAELAACACLLTFAAGPAHGSTGYPGLLQNDSSPTIGGDLAVGGTVSASPGGWSGEGPIAYAYQWERCQPACVTVPGATSPTYMVGTGDLAGRLRVVVTASNALVSYAAPSATTIPVAPAAAQVRAALLGQLVPRDPTLAVAIGLSTRTGYRLPLDPPVAGRVTIDWYEGSHPVLPAGRAGLTLVARGSATIRVAGRGAVAIKPTARGRKLIKRSRQLTLTAAAGLVPARSLAVSAVRVFTLR